MWQDASLLSWHKALVVCLKLRLHSLSPPPNSLSAVKDSKKFSDLRNVLQIAPSSVLQPDTVEDASAHRRHHVRDLKYHIPLPSCTLDRWLAYLSRSRNHWQSLNRLCPWLFFFLLRCRALLCFWDATCRYEHDGKSWFHRSSVVCQSKHLLYTKVRPTR